MICVRWFILDSKFVQEKYCEEGCDRGNNAKNMTMTGGDNKNLWGEKVLV